MKKFVAGMVCLLLSPKPLLADEVNLTTYYPSPRGAYNELRAQTLQAVDPNVDYSWDLNEGTIVASGLTLIDEETGTKYRLSVSGGTFTLTDLESGQKYLFMSINEAD